MKRIIAIITVLMITALAGCSEKTKNNPPDLSGQHVTNGGLLQSGDSDTSNGLSADRLPITGKIVIITNTDRDNKDEFLSAVALVLRFGEDYVVHKTWPDWDTGGVERNIVDLLQGISEDLEVKALILSSSIAGEMFVIDALNNVRDDIFVVYTAPLHFRRFDDVDVRADLIIRTDVKRLGELYVMQAITMGVDTIAHYSYPRHWARPAFTERRDSMIAAAEREGIRLVEIDAPDPWGDGYRDASQMFITQDLPRQVERLGMNTAFFITDCFMQPLIISQTIAAGAMFVLPCCPSPFHGYPEAIGIEQEIPTGDNDDYGIPVMRRLELLELIKAIDEAVDADGMTDRISSWAVSDSMMWTTIGFMYTVEWLNGNVPRERGVIDLEVLRRLAMEYTALLGVDTVVTLDTLTNDGEAIGHYVLGVIDYHVFGRG